MKTILTLLALGILIGCDRNDNSTDGSIEELVDSGGDQIRYVVTLPDGPRAFPMIIVGPGPDNMPASHEDLIRVAIDSLLEVYTVLRYDKEGTGTLGAEIGDLWGNWTSDRNGFSASIFRILSSGDAKYLAALGMLLSIIILFFIRFDKYGR